MIDGGKKHETAGLTANQERVGAALAGGMSIAKASSEFDVGERTIFTWSKEARFREFLDQTRRQLLDAALGTLADSAALSLDTLRGLQGADNPPSVRLGAAKAILENLVRYNEHLDISERVERIERALAENKGRNSRHGSRGR